VLARNLLECRFGDSDLIGGAVRAGVARAQHARQRLACLIAIGEDRMKAEAALEVPRSALLLGVTIQQRRVGVDRDLRRCADELPDVLACGRVRALKRLEHPRRRRDLVEHPKRRRVRRHCPNRSA
jgi:hypothetical protein